MSFKIPLAFRVENGVDFLIDKLPMPMLEESHNGVKIKAPTGLKLEKFSTLRFNESFIEDSKLYKVV